MWTCTEISGKPADVFMPEKEPSQGALIYLHGYADESLSRDETFTNFFEEYGLRVVCPHGGPCWWLDTLYPEFDPVKTPLQYVAEDVAQWVSSNWNVETPHIALLGVSMGGQGVLNLAYRKALKFPVVAALSPAIDFDRIYGKGFAVEEIFPNAEAARQETVVLHLHPLNWPKHQFFSSDPQDPLWHAGSERLASKLASSGVPFTCDLKTSHGGHGWPYFHIMAEPAVKFIANALKAQS